MRVNVVRDMFTYYCAPHVTKVGGMKRIVVHLSVPCPQLKNCAFIGTIYLYILNAVRCPYVRAFVRP